jgi:porin
VTTPLPRFISAFLVLILVDWSTAQQSSSAPADSSQSNPPWKWTHLSDDWFGSRSRLEDHGITFNIDLTSDWGKNFVGGLNTAGSDFGQLFDFSLTLDTQRLLNWPGGTVYFDFQNINGEFGSTDVGDIQNVDSFHSDPRTQLAELWYEQFFLDYKLYVRVGKIDAGEQFNITSDAINFINDSMSQTANIAAFPAYPDPACGGEIFVQPNDHFYAGAGIFDGALQHGIETGNQGPATLFGAPGDLFYIGEAGFKWNLHADLPGTIGIGAWRATGKFDRFNGGADRGTDGIYLVADQMLYRMHPHTNDPQGLGSFLRYGWADPHVSAIEHHIAGGVAWTGLFPKRDADVLGLGATCALLSRDRGTGFDERAEVAVESFYKIQITPFFSVEPDVQYIINPGGIAARGNALFAMLRMSVEF